MANPLKDPYVEAAPRGGKPVDPAQIKTAAPMTMSEAPSMAVPGMVVPPVGSANIQANAAGADAAGRMMANAAALSNRPLVDSAKDGPLSLPRPEGSSFSPEGNFTVSNLKNRAQEFSNSWDKGNYAHALGTGTRAMMELPGSAAIDVGRGLVDMATSAPVKDFAGGVVNPGSAPTAPKPAGAPAAIPASPDGGIPLGSQNPLRMLERNAGIASPGSAPLTQAPKLKFGEASAPNTFGNGYTDMGGGIGGKGSGSRGQPNDFTNIGADGKPTALSQGDSRTPDQIANGEKIKAQTAATVAAAGGLGNLQRQNSLMAANIRDGVDPHRGFNGPQVSIMQNTSGSGRGKDDLASLVKSLKGSGIKVSHNTLRSIIAAQSQQQAAQIQANASMYGHDSTSRTQLATNANTVAAQREGNQLQADTAKYGHDLTAQSNRIRNAFEQKKFSIEQGWKQVDHNRAMGNDTRQAREHGEKMFNESVGRMFPGQEGAADAAAFTKAAHHTIANHVNNLRKSGSPEAMAKAQELEANPWSSEMMSRLAQGYQVRKTSAANHGNWGTPGSGKHVESDDLFSYTADPTRKTDKGMFDNEVPLRNGGTISENAASGTSAIKNAFGYGQRTQDQINYINQR